MRPKVSQDIDIDQLEAGEIEQNSRIQGWHHERWPWGTFTLSESEQYQHAGLAVLVKAIQGGTYDFHILDLSWAERSTSTVNKLIAEVTPPRPTSSHDHPMLQQVAMINYRDSFFKPSFAAHIRELNLASMLLEDAQVPILCKLLTNNAALSSLDLSNNDLGGEKAMADLGAAVGSSGLRHLKFNANPLSPASFIAFIEALPATGCSLHALDMSTVLVDPHIVLRDARDNPPTDETLEAARAIAALVGDSQRCRNLGHLRLNGNRFGSRGTRAITASVVGSVYTQKHAHQGVPVLQDLCAFYSSSTPVQQKYPNRSLVEVSLLGNGDNEWTQSETSTELFPRSQQQRDQLHALWNRLQRIPTHLRTFLFRYFAERPWLRRSDSTKKTSQKREISSQDTAIFKEILQAVGGNARDWARDFQELVEIGSGVDLFDWKILLRNAELANVEYRDQTRLAAFRVLTAARVSGCRARRALPSDPPSLVLPDRGPTDGPKNVPVLNFDGKNTTDVDHISPFPFFLELPPEVRLLILRQLDTDGVLSDQQFRNIVSFACEPSTINYAANLREWTPVLLAARAEKKGNVYSSSTLPAQPWSWSECFLKRSAPRRLGGHDSFSTCVAAALKPQEMAFLEATVTQHADPTVAFPPLPVEDQKKPPRPNYAAVRLAGLDRPTLPFGLEEDSDAADPMSLAAFGYDDFDEGDYDDYDFDDDLEDALSMDGLDSGDDFY